MRSEEQSLESCNIILLLTCQLKGRVRKDLYFLPNNSFSLSKEYSFRPGSNASIFFETLFTSSDLLKFLSGLKSADKNYETYGHFIKTSYLLQNWNFLSIFFIDDVF